MLTIEQKLEYQRLSQSELNNQLTNACKDGHLEIIKYLLTSQDLKSHADIHSQGDYAVRIACERNYVDIVKYLLSSPELTEYTDIHVQDDWLLVHSLITDKKEMINFFIFDCKIEKTIEIENIINNSPLLKNRITEINNLFDLRDLNKSLENDLNLLNLDKKNDKKIKL